MKLTICLAQAAVSTLPSGQKSRSANGHEYRGERHDSKSCPFSLRSKWRGFRWSRKCQKPSSRSYWTDKSVSPSHDGFHESWFFRRIRQSAPKSVNRAAQPVVEIDKCIGPETFAELLTRHELTRLSEKNHEHFDRLSANFQPHSRLSQFSGSDINLERSEVDLLMVKSARSE